MTISSNENKNNIFKEEKEMEKKWVIFENYYVEEEEETITFYFKCNNEVLKEFGVLDEESFGGRISLEFPCNCIELKECSSEISPIDEDDECYNWTDALIDYTEIEKLLNLIPKPMYDLAIAEIEEKEKREMKEFKTTRTEEEIYEYLMLTNKGFDKGIVFGLIEDAQTVENKYYNELLDHKYEYACACDFLNSPFILEDEDDDIELVKVEQIGGIVVYEKRDLRALYEEYKKEWLKDHNVSEEEQAKMKQEYEQYLTEEWENPEFFTLDDFIFLCNGYEAGCYVCFDEWYNNEYQQMLEEENNEKEVM